MIELPGPVLVTGATGFVGRHLVEELLRRDGTIHVLVREGSRGRLEELIERWGAADRVVPVVGDLSKPALGIEGFDQKIETPIGRLSPLVSGGRPTRPPQDRAPTCQRATQAMIHRTAEGKKTL